MKKKKIHKFHENFIKNYDEERTKGYIFEVYVEYHKNLLNLHGDLPFLTERKKIKTYSNLVCNINDKENSKTSIKSWTNFNESTLSNSV